MEKNKEFYIIANYDLPCKFRYLYIYTDNQNNNKPIVKIYFKQNTEKNSKIDYLNSDYSTIDFNSGLFIPTEDLKYNSALIYIISYVFPSYSKYSNFQFNQFILGKGEEKEITFIKTEIESDYILILSKTSLRNIEVKAVASHQDITEQTLSYLYPNGCSLFLNLDTLPDNYIHITIKNTDNLNNQILLLGYMHHKENEIFPISITNGLQLYIEANNDYLEGLSNPGNNNFEQYFTYQTYNKLTKINFYDLMVK